MSPSFPVQTLYKHPILHSGPPKQRSQNFLKTAVQRPPRAETRPCMRKGGGGDVPTPPSFPLVRCANRAPELSHCSAPGHTQTLWCTDQRQGTQYLCIARCSLMYGPESHVHNVHTRVTMSGPSGFHHSDGVCGDAQPPKHRGNPSPVCTPGHFSFLCSDLRVPRKCSVGRTGSN